MGLNIGSLLSDVGIKLPDIDLGNIGQTVLDEGKQLLGDVVKDTFTLSSQPGEVFSDDLNLNVLGNNVSLPNPVGQLANSLLGKADDFLGQYGVNVDFKSLLGKVFNLPTDSGDSVAVPSVADRALTSTTAAAAAGANATGGGAVVASDATAGSGAAAVGGASATTTVTPTVGSGYTVAGSSNADAGLVNALGSADSNLNNLIGSINGDMSAADLAKVQAQIQQAQELISTLSNLLKDEHDMRMSILANVRTQ